MAFEASHYENGRWTTRTWDVNAVLQQWDKEEQHARMPHMDVEKSPVLGILTQTVIRSPLVHWIFPVRLRDEDHNDVAFVGDDFVQIKELRPDRLLWDVTRKENFGARIRNAHVIGSMKAYAQQSTRSFEDAECEDDGDSNVAMSDGFRDGHYGRQSSLPPQLILLQLDTGDSVFLMLERSEAGVLMLVSSRHRAPKSMLKLQPGIHLTVDPSSRYMAVGCSEALFAIYAIRSREDLTKQRHQGMPLRPVEFETFITVKGIILKMYFLHPKPDDEQHIILLLLVVVKGRTRMLLYEWETGNDLKSIRAHNNKGHLLNDHLRMPLLLIPLRARSAFALIYQDSITVCLGLLEGSPEFHDLPHRVDEPTKYHHGKCAPLWTAWARAPRNSKEHQAMRDDIYVVREDGVLKFLGFHIQDATNERVSVGYLQSNCGTALACLDYSLHKSNFRETSSGGDFLITGGDSSAGGTYLIQARKVPELIEPIRNWSPAGDLVTTYKPGTHEIKDTTVPSRHPGTICSSKPDRVFACSGKGVNGAIIELRHGLEAKLALSMEYATHIQEAWAFDSNSPDTIGESLFLLSLGDRSAVLRLSADAKEISDDELNTKFDLKHRTVAAGVCQGYTVQVTEQSIVFITDNIHRVYKREELFVISDGGTYLGNGDMVAKAIVSDEYVLFTTTLGNTTYLQILQTPDPNAMETTDQSQTTSSTKVRTISKHAAEISGMGICSINRDVHIVTAENLENIPYLVFTHVDSGTRRELQVPTKKTEQYPDMEAMVSIVATDNRDGLVTLLCGSRSGFVTTLVINENTFEILNFGFERFGVSQATIKRDSISDTTDLFFVCCDSSIYGIRPAHWCQSRIGRLSSPPKWNVQKIWLTDAKIPELQQPEINFIARLMPSSYGGSDGGLLLIAGEHILLAAFSTQEKTVPRRLPVNGTPTRLLYSHSLDILVVAAIVGGKSTLLLLDPATGDDLCLPIDPRTKEPVSSIRGLGNVDERIYHLMEWPYVKDNQTWFFIVVTTNTGRLLIISAQPGAPGGVAGRTSQRQKIRCHMRHKFKTPDPVFSVTALSGGLVWCAGNKLFWDRLDNTAKKFVRLAECELLSPATSLSCKDGTIYALTNCHSLEILKIVVENDDGFFKMAHTHVDHIARNTLHYCQAGDSAERPIHFVSDKECSVVGLWATQDTKADTLETIFEAQLPHSVLRFRYGRVRPVWDPVASNNPLYSMLVKQLYGEADVGSSGHRYAPDMLGLSLDGSVSHLSILGLEAWRFLRFLLNLALRSSRVCEFSYRDEFKSLEPLTTPKIMMHVDGDILKRCLDEQHLEHLLRVSHNTEEASEIFSMFYELLQELHQGTLEVDADAAVYVHQAYEDLAFFLRPVL